MSWRRRLVRLGVGLVLSTILMLVVAAWLLHSERGRDVVLHRLVAQLPAGARLHWTQAEGTLAGPLRLRDVQLTLPVQRDADCIATPKARCAMGQFSLHMQYLRIEPALRSLLGGRLRLETLALQNVTVAVPRNDTAFSFPQWPELLPTLALPFAIQADALHLENVRILKEGQALLVLQRVRGGVELQNGSMHIAHLRIESDHGRFTVHGDYAPRRNYRTDLVATAVLPAPMGQPQPQLGLVARGDLHKMVVAIGGRAPAPVRASVLLQGQSAAPRWQLRTSSEALDLGLLAGGGKPGTVMAFAFEADGVDGEARLHGWLRQGNNTLQVQPSQLHLQGQHLRVKPLIVDGLGGRITANGDIDLRDPEHARVQLALRARGVRWESKDMGSTAVIADADLDVDGTLAKWVLQGSARLQRGAEHAIVAVSGSGNRDNVDIDRLHVQMPQGQLDAKGSLRWSPLLQWDANAQLAGFDPGYFAPDWPGILHGQLQSSGQRQAGGRLRMQAALHALTGRLRGRPVRGEATLSVDGEDYAGQLALGLGGSQIKANGTLGARVDIDASVSPLQLNDLLPSGSGTLTGRVSLHGSRAMPDIAVALVGKQLALGDYRVEALQAQGQLPAQRGNGELVLQARGVQAGIALHRLHARVRGALTQLQVVADLQSDLGTLALTGDAHRQRLHWQGGVSQLQLSPTQGPTWALQRPLQWRWDGQNGSLSQACLASTLGGTLCVNGEWPGRGLAVQGHALPLALLADALPKREDGQPWRLRGQAELTAQVLPAGNSWRGQLHLLSMEGGLRDHQRARRELFGYRDLQLDVNADAHRFDAKLGAALSKGGRMDARLTSGWDAQAPLTGQVQARLQELTWLELFSPDIVEPSGQLNVDIRLAGRRDKPLLAGNGELLGFAAELPALGIALQNGSVQMQALADGSARINGQASTGQGVLNVEGSLDWLEDATPLQLRVYGSNVLLADTRQLHVLASPDIRVSYRAGAPLQVQGRVMVPAAQLHLERLVMGVSPSSDVVVLDPQTQAAATPLAVDMDLAVSLGTQVQVDGYGLAGSLAGNLHVRQPPGRDMRANGALDVSGRYRAYGQNLHITRGRMVWSNALVGDPLLDIRAEREVGDVVAGVQVRGRASAPEASVYSDPAMSQSEALAYLTLGRPLSTLSGREAQQLGAAKSALNAGSGLLAAELGARIGLDEAGVIESRALGSEVLGVGKYLSPKLYVSYGVSLLGTGQVVTLKYLLRKGFDVQIESSTVQNRASVNWRTEK